MTRHSAAACLLWAALTIVGAAQQTRVPSTTYSEPPPSPAFSAAKAGFSDRDVTYCRAAGVDLKLDISATASGGA